MEITAGKSTVNNIARAGLIAKGVVYVMLGIIGFMTAFELGSQVKNKASTAGVFSAVEELPAGRLLLMILAAGLICYTLWRFIQAGTLEEDDNKKKWGKRARYIFSGLAYGSLAYTAIRIILHMASDNKDQKQQMASQLLAQDYGQALAVIAALIFAAIGAYQMYYGIAAKYKKHLQKMDTGGNGHSLLLKSARIGYISRGIVWLVIAYLFFNAAIHGNSSEAGDTGKAFEFIEASVFGSYLLGILSLGVIMYGTYNFIRALYDSFK